MRHRWGVYLSRIPANSPLNNLKASNELKPVRVLGSRLFVTVNGLIGDVSANIKFYNHLPVTAPAVFLFPLTFNTTVRQCRATIVRRADFTKKYVTLECCQVAEEEDNSKAGFVIEQSASNVVELQLGVLSPGDEVEIALQYAILFDVEQDGCIKFLFPTFLPRQLQSTYTELCAPEIYQAADLQCRAVVSGTYRIHKIVSDCKLQVNFKNEKQRYAQIDVVGSYPLSKDFTLGIQYSDLNKPHVHVHSPSARNGELGHWLSSSYCAHLTLHHVAKKAASPYHKNEYILCIDRSGSMYGNKMELVRETVTYFIRFLQPGSYFNIVSYGSTIHPLFKTSQKLTAYSAMKALKLRKSLKADMFATNIQALLRFVFTQSNKTHSCKQIYLITDGAVDNPEECIDLVKKNSETSRLFTFGLDKTASRHLVTNLARAGNGKSFYLRNPQGLCQKVVDAMRLSAQSSLTNLSVTVQVPSGLELSTQPDIMPTTLFSDETLSVCLIISGQTRENHTRCKVRISGKLEGEQFEDVKEFDLKDALVTHGSPLHQLAIKTHLHNLEKDVKICRNADEILEIHQEMVDLSLGTYTACKQTKYVSVDVKRRCILNDLPVVICRPEDNLSPHSSTVKVKFKHGIDVFRSSQVALKSLMCRQASLSRNSMKSSNNSVQRVPLANRKVRSYVEEESRKHEQQRSRIINGQRFSTTQGVAKIQVAKVAQADTDSCRSSLVRSELDDMSFMHYDDDSLPPELFNIIEEYSDGCRTSQASGVNMNTSAQRRPTELAQFMNKGVNSTFTKPSGRPEQLSPTKIASTSDYYSLEVSPVSDVLSSLDRKRKHALDDRFCRIDAHPCHGSVSSSGMSSSCYCSETTYSSIPDSSIASTYDDPDPKYESVWQQFRRQERETAKQEEDKRAVAERNAEGRLALHNPSLLDLLIREDTMFDKQAPRQSTPKKSGSSKKQLLRKPTRRERGHASFRKHISTDEKMSPTVETQQILLKNMKPFDFPPKTSAFVGYMSPLQHGTEKEFAIESQPATLSVNRSSAKIFATEYPLCKEIAPVLIHHRRTEVLGSQPINQQLTVVTDNHAPILLNPHKDTQNEMPKIEKAQIAAEPQVTKIEQCSSPPKHLEKPTTVQDSVSQSQPPNNQGTISWKGIEVKHTGNAKYGGKFQVKPTTEDNSYNNPKVSRPQFLRDSILSDGSYKDITSFPMMDEQTSISDLSTLVREYKADKYEVKDKHPQEKTEPQKDKHTLTRSQKIRKSFRNSFRRWKRMITNRD